MIDLNVYNTCVFVFCKRSSTISTVSLYIEQPLYVLIQMLTATQSLYSDIDGY